MTTTTKSIEGRLEVLLVGDGASGEREKGSMRRRDGSTSRRWSG